MVQSNMWAENFFGAVKEALGFAKQQNDPEVIRLSKLRDIDKKLEKERVELDDLLAEDITDKNKEDNAYDLGVVVNNIRRLQREKATIKK